VRAPCCRRASRGAAQAHRPSLRYRRRSVCTFTSRQRLWLYAAEVRARSCSPGPLYWGQLPGLCDCDGNLVYTSMAIMRRTPHKRLSILPHGVAGHHHVMLEGVVAAVVKADLLASLDGAARLQPHKLPERINMRLGVA